MSVGRVAAFGGRLGPVRAECLPGLAQRFVPAAQIHRRLDEPPGRDSVFMAAHTVMASPNRPVAAHQKVIGVGGSETEDHQGFRFADRIPQLAGHGQGTAGIGSRLGNPALVRWDQRSAGLAVRNRIKR